MPRIIEGELIRTVLRWQLLATAASMFIAGIWSGPHGAFSALAGGFINFAAGTVFGVVVTHSRKGTPREATRALIRAEAFKLASIVAQLWLVLLNYKQLLLAPFFGTFVVTVILSSIVFFVRDR